MLSPSEFTVAALTGARHMTFVVPHDGSVGSFLTLRIKNRGTFAIFLTGEDRFTFFHFETLLDEEDADILTGIVIPEVAIEVDEASAYDANNGNRPFGSLLRTQDRMEIVALSASHRAGTQRDSFPLLYDLPPCETGARAGFTRWQIVIGTGIEKRVLLVVDCATAQKEG